MTPLRHGPRRALRGAALAATAAALLGACATAPQRAGEGSGTALAALTDAAAPAGAVLRRGDVLWLERVGFGLDRAGLAQYRALGRARFLDAQLAPRAAPLPEPIATQIDALEVTRLDPLRVLADLNAQNRAINAMPDGPDKEQARRNLNEHGNQLAYQAIRRDLLRAVYSPAQLREQMVWFWLNHFSVYQYKANVRWLVGDYAERAIRPHALGHFRDLLLATLEHPAMLQYLDNAQNAAGHINENYARELMELHTLGVGSGYTQHDVQELARVLTGVGVNAGDAPRLAPAFEREYRRIGAFEFNPARHDFGPKTLFGQRVGGTGFGEVEAAVTLIVRQSACAHFISRELATWFVADDPPPSLVERMAQTFQRTDGDIAAVLRTMFLSSEFDAALGAKFRDPLHFVLASVRLAYDGQTIRNTRPLLNWLSALGEAPYGRVTPDGYPYTEPGWASPGQLSRRFEIARAIGLGNAGLFDPEDGSPATTSGFPQLENRVYFEAIEPFLSASARAGLARANSQGEWNSFLLSSPDFSYQ
jgi:uncharacterized protein (DUF1800 family)